MRKRSANVAAAMYLCESATAETTKRPVGTEINLLFCRRAILLI
ncbi:hypothetical protein ACQKNB_06255 [Lysinibacillus xylanilyticus]